MIRAIICCNCYLLDKLKVKGKKKKTKAEDMEVDEPAQTVTYSEEVTEYNEDLGFQDMNLSRPLLKVCAVMISHCYELSLFFTLWTHLSWSCNPRNNPHNSLNLIFSG